MVWAGMGPLRPGAGKPMMGKMSKYLGQKRRRQEPTEDPAYATVDSTAHLRRSARLASQRHQVQIAPPRKRRCSHTGKREASESLAGYLGGLPEEVRVSAPCCSQWSIVPVALVKYAIDDRPCLKRVALASRPLAYASRSCSELDKMIVSPPP